MNANKSLLITLALASMTLMISGAAFAHSNHGHSTVPFKWKFSKKLQAKIERNLNSSQPTGAIGLNPLEQKNFNHYGIKVGNKFSSIVRNVDVTFERTSAGLRVTDASVFYTAMKNDVLPFKEISKVSNISLHKYFHPGHDKRLSVEWVFGKTTNAKIAKKMFSGKSNPSVGLNRLEQNLLNEYGIKPGSKFELSISGRKFLVKRTSSGLIILKHIESANIANADLDKGMVKDNI